MREHYLLSGALLVSLLWGQILLVWVLLGLVRWLAIIAPDCSQMDFKPLNSGQNKENNVLAHLTKNLAVGCLLCQVGLQEVGCVCVSSHRS